MAKTPATSTRFWLDQYNLTGLLTAADMEVKQTNPVTTCLSDTGPRRVVDNYDHAHQYSGLFDAGANSLGTADFDGVVDSLRGNHIDRYLAELFAGGTEGNPCYESMVTIDGMPRSVKAGQAIILNLNAQGANGLSRSTILRNATISGNGNGTGRNMGATTSGQVFQVVVRVFSGTFTSFDWAVQESQNDGGADPYATIAGLSGTISRGHSKATNLLTNLYNEESADGSIGGNHYADLSWSLFGDGAAWANLDRIYFGNTGGTWGNLYIPIGRAGVAPSGSTYTWEYYHNVNGWTAFAPTVSAGFPETAGLHTIAFGTGTFDYGNWSSVAYKSVTAHWIRYTVSTGASVTTYPVTAGQVQYGHLGCQRATTTAATEAWKRLAITNFVGTGAVIAVTAGVVQGT